MPPFGVPAGILSALSFGLGDFAGAVAARRAGALAVVAGAHAVGLVVLVGAAILLRPPLPGAGAIGLGLGAGIAGMIGLAALYRGMAIGRMGLVTALSGSGALAIPLVAGALLGARVTPLQLAGIACAAAAAVAASGVSRTEMGRQALLLAGLAATAFGAWYVLVGMAASEGDLLWALVCSRASSSLLAALAAVGRIERGRFPLRVVVAAGIFDVGGNAFYIIAQQVLDYGPAAALSGLYPIVTMLLARFALGERLPPLGLAGVALAVAGVVLISIGAP